MLTPKKTILIILILLIILIGFYFINKLYLADKNETTQVGKQIGLENLFEFKVVRTDLTEQQIADYRDKLEAEKQILLTVSDNFDFNAINSIGMIKRILHDYAGARDAWEYLSDKSPDNSLSYFNLGALYMEDLKDNPKAEANYAVALKNSRNDADNGQYYHTIVDFYNYYYPEHSYKIEEILLDALTRENKTDEFEILILLATYYQNNNKNAEAIEYWEKALVLDPDREAIQREIDKLKNK